MTSQIARLLLLLAILTTWLNTANGQHAEVYGSFAITGWTPDGFGSPDGQWIPAFGGGVDVVVYRSRDYAFKVDLRGSRKSGRPGMDSLLVGLVVATSSPTTRFHYRAEVAGGILSERLVIHEFVFDGQRDVLTPLNYSEQFPAVELLGGVDYKVAHHLDVRLIEVGIGTANNGTFSIWGSTGRAALVLPVSAGLVLHF